MSNSLYILGSDKTAPLGRRITPEDTLVKYGTPRLVAVHQVTIPPLQRLKDLIEKSESMDDEQCPRIDKSTNCAETGMTKKESDEILNFILPPNEWEENRKFWRQTVSSDPSVRRDVIELTDQLDMRLTSANASDLGVNDIRRKMYTQCFDELIRQTTIRCAERGLMLYLCRQEIDFSLSAYKKLYISSGAYAIRKTLFSIKAAEFQNTDVGELVVKNDGLKNEIRDIRDKINREKRKYEDQRKIDDKQRHDELEALNIQRIQLQRELDLLVVGKRIVPITT